MIVKIKDNLWTHFEWWSQLLINKNKIIVRKIGSDDEVESELIIAENKDEEELKKLLDYLHGAAVNGEESFNVENWISRIKNKEIDQEN